MSNPRIGFIGVGMMGHGMAKHLLAKGFPLAFTVHRDRSRLDDLLAAGAREVGTPAELAAASDVVILCVTGSPQVEANVFGENGLLAAARKGLTVVDTSTGAPHAPPTRRCSPSSAIARRPWATSSRRCTTPCGPRAARPSPWPGSTGPAAASPLRAWATSPASRCLGRGRSSAWCRTTEPQDTRPVESSRSTILAAKD